jgi:hypothetical protein
VGFWRAGNLASLDLRKRVVAAVATGQTCRAVAERFGVTVASVVKWSRRFRATSSAAAKPIGARRPYALEGERHWVLRRASEAPDLTLRALTAELASVGSRSATCGLALPTAGRHHVQKSLRASEQDRPDVARRRARWKRYQGRLDPRRLVFTDETWAKTNMTRSMGVGFAASGWSQMRLRGAGARSPSSPRYVPIGSMRLV